jgi:hypothetical protein
MARTLVPNKKNHDNIFYIIVKKNNITKNNINMSTGYPRLKRNISNKNSWIQITNTELGVRLRAAKSYEKKVETVMVNNSTNINKTNNHLSPQIIEHMVFEIRWDSINWFNLTTLLCLSQARTWISNPIFCCPFCVL